MISVGMIRSSPVCIASNCVSARSSRPARTSAPSSALYTAAFRRAPHRSPICWTMDSASIHRPWHPRQCTYAPHITVGGGPMNRLLASASFHTESASSCRPLRSAAETRCVNVYASGRRWCFANLAYVLDAPSQSPSRAYPPRRQLNVYVVTTRPRVVNASSSVFSANASLSPRAPRDRDDRVCQHLVEPHLVHVLEPLGQRQRLAPPTAPIVSFEHQARALGVRTTRAAGLVARARNTSAASSHRRASRRAVKVAVYTHWFLGSPASPQSRHTWYAAGQFSHRANAVIAADATSEHSASPFSLRALCHAFTITLAWCFSRARRTE